MAKSPTPKGAMPPATRTVPQRGEATPGLMATRNHLRNIREASIAHVKKGGK